MKIGTSTALALLLGFNAGASVLAFAPNSARSISASSLQASSVEEAATAQKDLEQLASDLNPSIGYWDPLALAQADFFVMGQAATIGFLRHSEIKHGRVAMAAFVGYCIQSNWHFPWPMTTAGDEFPSIDLAPEAQWDAIPVEAKYQILFVVALFETWDEIGGGRNIETDEPNYPHYMKGRMPGKYPSLQQFRDSIHWTPDLFDPAGFSKNMSEAKKAKGRIAEINNGRLAMLGIISFIAADKIPGAVPLLGNIAMPYDGNVMAPFANDFTLGWGS
eukprot:CAMPEP_0194411018 /NCGR_PEP_ID=MMETSP0176-20130528/9139_1 /TAXON_ID=216777 /ORGANISM="Proboscia alata, Strain PI-D3" /LENGTH=275 /DNA_ID=CAMNT_0039212711 /DNA_START=41 /DNA_END=868 /DNA_ORIENTATION=+